MTIHKVSKIRLTEDYTIIEMNYQEFRKFFKGAWRETDMFLDKEGNLYAFLRGRQIMVCKLEKT